MTSLFSRVQNQSSRSQELRSRFETCLSLDDGQPSFSITRVDPLFEEQAFPVSVKAHPEMTSPTEWLLLAIERLAASAQAMELHSRPIHVPMPLAIFSEPSAADRAVAKVKSVGFCPQEFMLEFQDGSLAGSDSEHFDLLDCFRRAGFRIALDARKSCETPFSERIRHSVERLRLNAEELKYNETVQMRADIVGCLGGEIIVDRANWRDCEELQKLGATHTLKLISDA